jgi:hypothetical protein
MPRNYILGPFSLEKFMEVLTDKQQHLKRINIPGMEKPFPPPAKLSPTGDEPILQERN